MNKEKVIMSKVVLLIGGNIGDRFENIIIAKNNIVSDIGKINKESSIYESEPWGFDDNQNFLNQVVDVQTNLLPYEILNRIHIIESKMGRERSKTGYSSRPMDIDILFFDDIVIDLLESSTDPIHPLLKITITDLLNNCSDKSDVKKYIY
jgi:2-amino-4-hydroxy-6-hydroxymethyldihydropteridine diphosphokinase